jgi:hypothetical protein
VPDADLADPLLCPLHIPLVYISRRINGVVKHLLWVRSVGRDKRRRDAYALGYNNTVYLMQPVMFAIVDPLVQNLHKRLLSAPQDDLKIME